MELGSLGTPLWLWFIIFAIVIVVGAVVVWYLQKLVWYLFSKSQEKEFDEARANASSLVIRHILPIGFADSGSDERKVPFFHWSDGESIRAWHAA